MEAGLADGGAQPETLNTLPKVQEQIPKTFLL